VQHSGPLRDLFLFSESTEMAELLRLVG